MSLRAVPDSMDPTVVGSIDAELDRVAREHRVNVRLAVESGSRAWGFPSPDSDYDCRFVYVAHLDTYLSPWTSRDVIETPLVGLLDVNGWDLTKALRLLVAGNAVLIEWLMSPIVYRGDAEFRTELRELAARVTDRDRVARHYLHLGGKQWALHHRNGSLKKVFYSLRPAMALRWLREHPDAAVAPMHLPTLLAECELPVELVAAIAELTELESRTREMGDGAVPAPIVAFLEGEFDRAAMEFPSSSGGDRSRARELTAEFFRAQALAVSR
ncbi:nucleotidyltransferase domain-containing protein [Nocardia puris]|uniref:nucleotidyltransferase domain-containing protein n=1 Tax=Nocardia puris TaxID=208602 RepID=UPI001894619F|nr:nucleotidyltransferase domain-containing protein [Nocardia puris]MBF6214453.1 nucleotidyltransferase domain-containing protein [Nocardia puris]MBF6369068.1 nucleotidyltransferase domain-containing protein [Nocardia puris]MBF6462784.1 nucleotidyltransferase domain-containing protein [Nocardia puris]